MSVFKARHRIYKKHFFFVCIYTIQELHTYSSEKRQSIIIYRLLLFGLPVRIISNERKKRKKKMYGKEELTRMMSHSGVLSKN